MGCKLCTTLPSLPTVNKYIVFASHEYLLEKLYELIRSLCSTRWMGQFLEVECEMNAFLERLVGEHSFTVKEKENIFIVPIEGDTVDITVVAKSKRLSECIYLYQARDYLRILEQNSLVVEFMPIVDIQQMTVFGFECLSRGKREDGTLVSPKELFRFAREIGALFYLDRACRMNALQTAHDKGLLDFHVFINFTPTAIYNPVFCLRDTVELAHELDFDFSKVVFEVIESEKVFEVEDLQNIMDFYVQKGFQVALDDIGSGFSSLRMLVGLMPNFVKLDIELVRDIHNNTVKYTVVKHLFEMSKNLGIRVVAEGVEKEEEFVTLQQIGVDFAQGYYFGKPSPEPKRSM